MKDEQALELSDETEAVGWIVTMWTCPSCEDVNEEEGDAEGDRVECVCGWSGTCRRG